MHQTWKGEVGFTRLQELCEHKRVRPMLDEKEIDLATWKEKDYKSKSRVSFECCDCSYTRTQLLSSFSKRDHRILCLCSEEFPWKSPEGYEEFKKRCNSRRCKLKLELDGWMDVVETCQSKVPIYCRKCDVVAISTNISNFRNGKLGCGCNLKTESMVREFLRGEFGHDAIISGWVTWCRNDVTKKMLPFDMILDPLDIIVEVDGLQHFKKHKHFKKTLPEIQARDAMKEEKAIKNGF